MFDRMAHYVPLLVRRNASRVTLSCDCRYVSAEMLGCRCIEFSFIEPNHQLQSSVVLTLCCEGSLHDKFLLFCRSSRVSPKLYNARRITQMVFLLLWCGANRKPGALPQLHSTFKFLRGGVQREQCTAALRKLHRDRGNPFLLVGPP